MYVKVITLSFSSRLQDFDTEVLERFVADKQVTQVEHHFFLYDQKPFLTLIVHYEAKPLTNAPESSKPTLSPSSSFNPRALLSNEEWPLFETLRQWRRTCSQKEGIPHYSVIKNQVLVDLIRQRPTSLAELGKPARPPSLSELCL